MRRLAVSLLVSTLLAGAVAAAPEEMIGGWHYRTEADAMTDAPHYTAYLKADESDNHSALVVLTCLKPKQIEFGVKFSNFLGNKRGMRDFTYRLDDRQAVTERWNYLGGDVVGKELSDHVKGLLTDTASARRLRVRAYKSDGTPVDADFALDDPKSAISRLTADCKLAFPP